MPKTLVMLLLEFQLSREKGEKKKGSETFQNTKCTKRKCESDFQIGLITLLASFQGGYAF